MSCVNRRAIEAESHRIMGVLGNTDSVNMTLLGKGFKGPNFEPEYNILNIIFARNLDPFATVSIVAPLDPIYKSAMGPNLGFKYDSEKAPRMNIANGKPEDMKNLAIDVKQAICDNLGKIIRKHIDMITIAADAADAGGSRRDDLLKVRDLLFIPISEMIEKGVSFEVLVGMGLDLIVGCQSWYDSRNPEYNGARFSMMIPHFQNLVLFKPEAAKHFDNEALAAYTRLVAQMVHNMRDAYLGAFMLVTNLSGDPNGNVIDFFKDADTAAAATAAAAAAAE